MQSSTQMPPFFCPTEQIKLWLNITVEPAELKVMIWLAWAEDSIAEPVDLQRKGLTVDTKLKYENYTRKEANIDSPHDSRFLKITLMLL